MIEANITASDINTCHKSLILTELIPLVWKYYTYISKYMRKITIRIQASPYRYGIPSSYGDFYEHHTHIVKPV